MTALLTATYACGNRFHVSGGERPPGTCPHDGCQAELDNIFLTRGEDP